MIEQIILSRRTRNLISETIAGESIIIDLEDGRYYRASGLASVLWDELERGVGFDHLRMIAGSRRGDVEPAVVARFALGLIDAALVTCDLVGRSALAGIVTASPETSSDLVLEIYDDMADLLLMDPVHDVGEQGWPAKPGEIGTDP